MHDHRAAAAELLRARHARDAVFGADRDGFGEPGWDMLLFLLMHDGDAVTEDEIVNATSASAGTAALYLRWAVSRGLVERTADTDDYSRVTVRLSERGMALMRRYLEEGGGV